MNYNSLLQKTFQTGNMKFKVVGYSPITNYSANLHVKLMDAGYFSTVTIDFGTDEILEGILSGQIWEAQ